MKRAVAFGIIGLVASLLTLRASVAARPDATGQSQATQQPQQQTNTPPPASTTTPPQAVAPATSAPAQYNGTIGGEAPVILTRPRSLNANQPQFLQATFLPGAGMNLFALKAYIPGRGDVDLIATTDLATAAPLLEGISQPGNGTLAMGASFFAPFAGVLRGTLSPDGKTIGAVIDGRRVWLQANWHGPESGAEAGAANGLILGSKFQVVSQHNGPDESTVFTTLHAGNFGGQWLSNTDLTIGATLHDASLGLYVMAKNAGDQEDPIGVGFLPYFVIPSGDRKQVRLTIPGDMRALVNNHQDDFPTGRIVSVDGTAYDFTSPNGTALGNFSLDDCFTDIQQAENDDNQGSSVNNNQIIQLIDPAAKYGLRIRILSQHIKAIQVYAPADKNFVAIGPQFNLPDPYARIWRGQDTGMVPLEEGKSAVWYIRLELFTPR
jgi:aldose 1-epimerase